MKNSTIFVGPIWARLAWMHRKWKKKRNTIFPFRQTSSGTQTNSIFINIYYQLALAVVLSKIIIIIGNVNVFPLEICCCCSSRPLVAHWFIRILASASKWNKIRMKSEKQKKTVFWFCVECVCASRGLSNYLLIFSKYLSVVGRVRVCVLHVHECPNLSW